MLSSSVAIQPSSTEFREKKMKETDRLRHMWFCFNISTSDFHLCTDLKLTDTVVILVIGWH